MEKSGYNRFVDEKEYKDRPSKTVRGLRERLREMREARNSLVEEIEDILYEIEGMSLREQAEEIVETLGM